jgi:hypothetical protein
MAKGVVRTAADNSQPKTNSKARISSKKKATINTIVVSNVNTPMKAAAAASTTASGSRKRKLADLSEESVSTPAYSSLPKTRSAKDITSTTDDTSPRKTGKKQKAEQEEKRLRVFRKKAPQSFLQKLERAQTQR